MAEVKVTPIPASKYALMEALAEGRNYLTSSMLLALNHDAETRREAEASLDAFERHLVRWLQMVLKIKI